jgi:CelD/BcsL family acetyltransferase involved in cellulose biosynthesis
MHAPLSPAFRAEWRNLAALADITDEWRSLAARALEPNVFYEPSFALHAAPLFGADAGAVLIWSRGRLMGLFPGRIDRWRGGFRPVLIGWCHPYAPLGTPLVDRNEAEGVLTAWLDHLAGDRTTPALLLLPYVPADGPLAAALNMALSRTNRASAMFGLHRRALLDPGMQRDGYLDRSVSSSRRKNLRWQRRRLEDIAPVTFTTVTSAKDVADAIKDFLVIEASGWKGLAGTAAANDTAVRGFVEGAVTALAAEGKARVDRLFLNGRCIAASVTLTSGNTGWYWKIAYSEGVARFSPGMQLMLESTSELMSETKIARVDSCAAPDHPMIDNVWRERLAVGDRLIAMKPTILPFGAACAIENARRYAISVAKGLRDRLRPKPSSPRPKETPDDLTGGRHRHVLNEGELARILMRR